MMHLRSSRAKLALSALGLAVLTGCASVSSDQGVKRVNDEAGSFTGGKLALARTQDERDQRAQAAHTLLTQPVGQQEAVQLALVNSPSLQALLAQGWAESADVAQVGRIANPIFSFERMRTGPELELARALSFGLLDLLTLPTRYGVATRLIEQSQLRLTSDVVDQVTLVRQANWKPPAGAGGGEEPLSHSNRSSMQSRSMPVLRPGRNWPNACKLSATSIASPAHASKPFTLTRLLG